MIINLSFYHKSELINFIEMTLDYFQSNDIFDISEDVIWLDGAYIKFSQNIITMNIFDENIFQIKHILRYFNAVLIDKELYISRDGKISQYLKHVDKDTNFSFLF